MKSRQELSEDLSRNPVEVAEYALLLQEQLSAARQELAQRQEELARQEQSLAEARAYIAELKRQLFGPKADKLSPEQEEQTLNGWLQTSHLFSRHFASCLALQLLQNLGSCSHSRQTLIAAPHSSHFFSYHLAS